MSRVEHHIETRIVGYETGSLSYAYDPAEPLAVTIGGGNDNWFRIARQLLSDGMTFPVGDLSFGDAAVHPDGDEVLIDLCGMDGYGGWMTQRLTVDADALAAFLDATFELVPEGAEVLDIDAGIALLLSPSFRAVTG